MGEEAVRFLPRFLFEAESETEYCAESQQRAPAI
jgi:hypothetical protein